MASKSFTQPVVRVWQESELWYWAMHVGSCCLAKSATGYTSHDKLCDDMDYAINNLITGNYRIEHGQFGEGLHRAGGKVAQGSRPIPATDRGSRKSKPSRAADGKYDAGTAKARDRAGMRRRKELAEAGIGKKK